MAIQQPATPTVLQPPAGLPATHATILAKAGKRKGINVPVAAVGAVTIAALTYFITPKGSAETPAPQQPADALPGFEPSAETDFFNLVKDIRDDLRSAGYCGLSLGQVDQIRQYVDDLRTNDNIITVAEVADARQAYLALRQQNRDISNIVCTAGVRGLFKPVTQSQPNVSEQNQSYNPQRSINPRAYRTLEREVANYCHGRQTGRL